MKERARQYFGADGQPLAPRHTRQTVAFLLVIGVTVGIGAALLDGDLGGRTVGAVAGALVAAVAIVIYRLTLGRPGQ